MAVAVAILALIIGFSGSNAGIFTIRNNTDALWSDLNTWDPVRFDSSPCKDFQIFRVVPPTNWLCPHLQTCCPGPDDNATITKPGSYQITLNGTTNVRM
jgi:hypothetical protein